MTVERQIELQDRLREVLGEQPAATLWVMLPGRDDLATKADLKGEITRLRDDLKADIGDVRKEVSDIRAETALIRQEMDLKFATKDDLLEVRRDFTTSVQGMVRTFVAVQAATVVGISGILYGFLRLT
jgi:hypothetical protein